MSRIPTTKEMIAVIRERGTPEQAAMMDQAEKVYDYLEQMSTPLGFIIATMPRWPCGCLMIAREFRIGNAFDPGEVYSYFPCDCGQQKGGDVT